MHIVRLCAALYQGMAVYDMNEPILVNISENLLGILPLIGKKIIAPKLVASNLRYPLTSSNVQVLFILWEIRRSTVSDLSKHLHVSRPNMTPLIDKLVEYGLVERIQSESDRRVIDVSITPSGDELCLEIRDSMIETVQKRLTVLEEEDLTQLNESLNQIKSILMKVDNVPF